MGARAHFVRRAATPPSLAFKNVGSFDAITSRYILTMISDILGLSML